MTSASVKTGSLASKTLEEAFRGLGHKRASFPRCTSCFTAHSTSFVDWLCPQPNRKTEMSHWCRSFESISLVPLYFLQCDLDAALLTHWQALRSFCCEQVGLAGKTRKDLRAESSALQRSQAWRLWKSWNSLDHTCICTQGTFFIFVRTNPFWTAKAKKASRSEGILAAH